MIRRPPRSTRTDTLFPYTTLFRSHRPSTLANGGEVAMVDLKLGRLPDRTPVKLTIMVPPDLHRALADYVVIYNDTYGQSEPLTELVPHMLAAFLASDRGFAKAREGLAQKAP